MVGLIVSVISTALGLLGAMAVTRYRLPGRGPVMGTIMLPLVVPSIILGVALLVILRTRLRYRTLALHCRRRPRMLLRAVRHAGADLAARGLRRKAWRRRAPISARTAG